MKIDDILNKFFNHKISVKVYSYDVAHELMIICDRKEMCWRSGSGALKNDVVTKMLFDNYKNDKSYCIVYSNPYNFWDKGICWQSCDPEKSCKNNYG